jgi:hypothetical protein
MGGDVRRAPGVDRIANLGTRRVASAAMSRGRESPVRGVESSMPATRQRRLRSARDALLVLSLAHSVAALFVPELPGWKMFAESTAPSWAVLDGAGQTVDVRRYLPRFAYGLDARQVARVARFICSSGTEHPPLHFRASPSSLWLEFSPPTCGAAGEGAPPRAEPGGPK